MKNFRISIQLFIISVIFLLSAFFIKKSEETVQSSQTFTHNIETGIKKKLNTLDKYVEVIKGLPSDDELAFFIKNKSHELTREGLGIFIFKNHQLFLWTNREYLPTCNANCFLTDSVQRQSNGWYFIQKHAGGDYTIFSTLLLKKEYDYNNPYLPTYFMNGIKVPNGMDISLHAEGNIPISVNDKTLFYLSSDQQKNVKHTASKRQNLFSFFGVLFFLIAFGIVYQTVSQRTKYKNLLLIAFGLDLLLIRWLMFHFQFPSGWYDLPLFSPRIFAENGLVNSLGNLLINAVFVLIFAIGFHKNFDLSIKFFKTNKSGQWAWSIISACSIIVLLIFSLIRIDSLINNSSVSYNFTDLLDVNVFSGIGLLIGELFLLSSLIAADKLFFVSYKINHLKITGILTFVLLMLLFLSDKLFFETINIPTLVYLGLFFLLLIIYRFKAIQSRITYFFGLIFSLFLSLVVTAVFNQHIKEKELRQQKVVAMNLSNERDVGAEYFIKVLNDSINVDTAFIDFLELEETEKAYEYFKNRYIKGYLDKYDFQMSICGETDTLLIEPENYEEHCYSFFSNIINETGYVIPETNFYFLDNNNGRISYLGSIPIQRDSFNIKVFLELNSQVLPEGPGYPELLLDKKLMSKSTSKYLSYAKYTNTSLITSKGAYNYPQKFNFPVKNQTYTRVNIDKWQHLIYEPSSGTFIVVSRLSKNLKDYLIFFTYIFSIFFILLNLMWLMRYIGRYNEFKPQNTSFKNKIQFYLVILVSVSILLIGTISIIFYVQRYREKQTDTIQEKMQSVQIELSHKFGMENSFTDEMVDYMNYVLVKLSNIFYTDINLYTVEGKLLATSRQEIYDKGLLGKRMETQALYRLKNQSQGYFVQNECIGNMKYLSAYMPLKNDNNDVLAYINLPYFSKQTQFREEISSLTVALITVYLVLFLITLLIAIFTANRLTKPLKMIQKSICEMDITKGSQKIDYHVDDEIGSLVKEYNKKIDELQESAQRLAQSERESAWREMAKQIAHEIKNPLTPMKLSVQHLGKAYKDKDPDLDFMFEKVSRTLIEQIDSLSHIATEFSNFAKIRIKNQEEVDLVERIRSATELFDGLSRTRITFDTGNLQKAIILADKEQILRVFNNLIKNAVQAIPRNRKGEIELSIDNYQEDAYIVKIKDNGKGIPEDIKGKVFSPNFTTKTSGMGLGLSIVKGIIENSNGTIRFTTEANKGTEFVMIFPKLVKS